MLHLIFIEGDKVKAGDLVWFATVIDTVSGDKDKYSLGILVDINRRKEFASILYNRKVVKIWIKNILHADYE